MMKQFFSPAGLLQDAGLALVRSVVGILLIYHGWEVWQEGLMHEYAKRLTELHFPSPSWMAYLGKSTELVSGIFLVLGFFTRLAAIALAITMTIICFGMGEGRIWLEEQHPFLFVLLALVFFFAGPGQWSLDQALFGRRDGKDNLVG